MLIESHFHPALVVLNGKQYIVPQWIPVPLDFQLQDIEWKPINGSIPAYKDYSVTGSNGDQYRVRVYDTGKAECDCWGWKRSRDRSCKHTKQITQC